MNSYWLYDEPLLENEYFKNVTIKGREIYYVSNCGRVRYTNGHLTFGSMSEGESKYPMVNLKDINGKNKGYYVHVLVALAFIPNPDPETLKVVNHKDSNKNNCQVSNLEWITSSDNTKHSYTKNHNGKTAVIHKHKTGEVISRYSSMAEAVRNTNFSIYTICKQCVFKKYGKSDTYFEFESKDIMMIFKSRVPVVQMNIETDESLFIWKSAVEASYYTEINYTGITGSVRGDIKSAGGFKWRNLDLFEVAQDIRQLDNINHLKAAKDHYGKIYEIDTQHKLVATYENCKTIKRKLKIDGCKVIAICEGKFEEDKGKRFLTEEEYLRREKLGEDIYQPCKFKIDENIEPIVVMKLNGSVIKICDNVDETAKLLRSEENGKYKRYMIKDCANCYSHMVGQYKFAFKQHYDDNPTSYTTLHGSIARQFLKKKPLKSKFN